MVIWSFLILPNTSLILWSFLSKIGPRKMIPPLLVSSFLNVVLVVFMLPILINVLQVFISGKFISYITILILCLNDYYFNIFLLVFNLNICFEFIFVEVFFKNTISYFFTFKATKICKRFFECFHHMDVCLACVEIIHTHQCLTYIFGWLLSSGVK